MNPAIEKKPTRYFHVQLRPSKEGGPWPDILRIQADTVCEPNDSRKDWIFKLDGEVIGKVKGIVEAWWIEDVTEL